MIGEKDLLERLEFAAALARSAGTLALSFFRQREALAIESKDGPQDLVSRADREVEAHIREALAARFPGEGFLGEETAASFEGGFERCWVVDPIDGTVNFLRGARYWCVSIAWVHEGERALGVIHDPCGDELFAAARGAGAWLVAPGGARQRLATSACDDLSRALVCLGHNDRGYSARYMDLRERLMRAGVAMRNMGAGALQLAHVAAGRYEAFIEAEMSPWDVAAGLTLVEEAGGAVEPVPPPGRSLLGKHLAFGAAPGVGPALRRLVG